VPVAGESGSLVVVLELKSCAGENAKNGLGVVGGLCCTQRARGVAHVMYEQAVYTCAAWAVNGPS